MAVTLGSNLSAQRITRLIGAASQEVERSVQRLGSGMRINRASDDAAGLAVADQLRVKSRLYSTASRNINDGISAINIIDGTLGEQTSILTRLQELAEQSANGTFSRSQRQSLNNEFQALVKEFGRLGDVSSFNGLNLLQGGKLGNVAQMHLQSGITGSSNSLLSITTGNTSTNSGAYDADLVTNPFGGSGTSDELSDGFNGQLFSASIVDSTGKQRDLKIGFVNVIDAGDSWQAITYVYQRASDTGGVGASSQVGMVEEAGDEWVLGYFDQVFFDKATGAQTGFGLNGGTEFNFTFDDGAVVENNVRVDLQGIEFFKSSETNGVTTNLWFSSIESVHFALAALDLVKARSDEVNSLRGRFGALQSRLDTANAVNGALKENTSAAESRIRDVDVSQEAAASTAAQIRQQAGIAALAQANLQPQIALSLLRG